MKAIIFSDSHKNFSSMIKAMEVEGGANYIIHAGDVHSDVEDLFVMYPKIPIAYVKGNNDPFLREPTDRVFELGGVKIFLTHGHNYGVKQSLFGVYKKSAEVGATLAVFGHTHSACNQEINGITLFNPGMTAKSYGVLEIENGKFSVRIKELF